MAANPYIRTITPDKANWTPLADEPLVLRAWVRIWAVAATTDFLSIRVAGSGEVAQLPKNVDFILDGVDLSQVEVQANNDYRVTIIGHTR